MDRIADRLRRRVHILDGAMGTMIQRLGLREEDFRGDRYANHGKNLAGFNDVLNISRPEDIYAIHRAYLEAGADMIETNTFNSNRLSIGEYGLEGDIDELNTAGVMLARRAVDDFCAEHGISDDERPLVVGSMGPTGVSLSLSDEVDFDTMASAYESQADSLMRAGADILLLETVFDTLNAKAAIYGLLTLFEKTGHRIPVMLSATLTEQGRLLSGQTLEEFIEATRHLSPLSVGLNCGFGAEALLPWVKIVSKVSDTFISVHPNAGLPDAMGNYSDSPEQMAVEVREVLESGCVNIIGGCCGTTPEHIRRIAETAGRYGKVRELPEKRDLERKFTKVGERCNVAGSRKFLRTVNEGDWQTAVEIAAGQIEKGAEMLDINMDDGLLDSEACMCKMVKLLSTDRRTCSTPLMIDSSDFGIIRSALRLTPLCCTVNSISLKGGEEEFLQRADEVRRLGARVTVMAFDEEGQATDFKRKISICERAWHLLTERVGFRGEDIIFDPNILTVATGMESDRKYAIDYLRAAKWIHDNLPGAAVSGGVSNLSFALRGNDSVRKAMHSVFLDEAIRVGMTMAIINPSTPLDADWVDDSLKRAVSDVLFDSDPEATSRLVSLAATRKKEVDMKKGSVKKAIPEKKICGAEDRLRNAITEGEDAGLEEMLSEVREIKGSAMKVVNDVLMPAIDSVGDMFGRGEIFLPQVVRSAGVMKRAISILTPFIEAENSGRETGSDRKKIVLATVKGDVHDIGKNIVAVVLRCSGYDVIDLGVMTPCEEILRTAEENGAVAIGLSGLITPSLKEMEHVADEMRRAGMRIPLFVGGATTSDLHTAVRLAPLYDGAVVHTRDAAALPVTIEKFTGKEKEQAAAELRLSQKASAEKYLAENTRQLSPEEARRLHAAVEEPAPTPLHPGEHIIKVKISDLEPLINRRALMSEWGVPRESEEGKRLMQDAMKLLSDNPGELTAKVIIAKARSEGDDIIIEHGGKMLRLQMARQRRANPVTGKCLCMSDFIYGGGDYIGLFAVTIAGSGIVEKTIALSADDEYRSLLLQSLGHRLAEAATEYMHHTVRKSLWGLGENDGIRPAVGYSSIPEQSLVFELDKLLDYSSLGIGITEHGALTPTGTTTGLIIGHPSSRYFDAR
ncbi:MAG: methionine synthase [Muribaculaceae bacterium]|nr:methionine synthase [Muribaculaceae bacterium]